jgi:hypothetical protein
MHAFFIFILYNIHISSWFLKSTPAGECLCAFIVHSILSTFVKLYGNSDNIFPLTRLVDKLEDIHSSRQFPVALELGSYRGHVLESLQAFNSVGIQHLVQLEAVRDREKTIQPLKVQGKDFFYDLDLLLQSANTIEKETDTIGGGGSSSSSSISSTS